MNVLADLLEVTATCIGDLVRETREVLEDHGHDAGAAAVRFATAGALLDFLDTDHRPARTAVIERLSHPALTGLTQHSYMNSPAGSSGGNPPKPNACPISGAADHASPAPAAASSTRRSATASMSCSPSSTTEGCARWTFSLTPSAASAGPPPATSSAKPCHCSSKKATFPALRRRATAQRQIFWPPEQRVTRRQVDSLRLHRARNVLAKVPAGMQAEVKDAYWKIFDTGDLSTLPGPRLVEIIDARISEMAAKYRPTYPSAVKCLTTDAEGLTAYLRFPAGHHHRIRHPDFIERTFGETRRRTKVISRLPGETSCLTLLWAVLDRASRGWRGLTMTSDGLRLLQDLRRSLLDPPRQLRPRTVTATRDDDRSENVSATA